MGIKELAIKREDRWVELCQVLKLEQCSISDIAMCNLQPDVSCASVDCPVWRLVVARGK